MRFENTGILGRLEDIAETGQTDTVRALFPAQVHLLQQGKLALTEENRHHSMVKLERSQKMYSIDWSKGFKYPGSIAYYLYEMAVAGDNTD